MPKKPTLSAFLGDPPPSTLPTEWWRTITPTALPTQAHRVIAKFGGPYALARLLEYSPSQVYRWTYEKDAARNGTGGVIPKAPLYRIIKLARRERVLLTSADLDPRQTGD